MSTPFEPAAIALDSRESTGMSAFIPVLILALVMLAWFTFQAMQLRFERDAIHTMMTAQDKTVADSQKLRDSLDTIARGTQQLADGGNPNARIVVDELKKHGITINPNPPTPTAPAK
jgi:hypothetical protein